MTPKLSLQARLPLLQPTVKAFPELGFHSLRDLQRLVELELGSAQALDSWVAYGDILTRARPPKEIYLICAHNLAISAWQGILRGLILGSTIHVKTSSSCQKEIRRFFNHLNPELKKLVKVLPRHSPRLMKQSEAVVVFGNDATLQEIAHQLSIHQRFLGYGHQVSLLWLGRLRTFTPELVEKVVDDLCAFDQLGCLSPQAIYLQTGSQTQKFLHQMAKALQKRPILSRPRAEQLLIAHRVQEFRGRYPAKQLLLPPDKGPAWTIVQPRTPQFQANCGYRTVHVHEIQPDQLPRALQQVKGHLSTVGLASPLSAEVENIFLELGVKRFCPIGSCQTPARHWHHDGRPQLSDLVHWVDREPGDLD